MALLPIALVAMILLVGLALTLRLSGRSVVYVRFGAGLLLLALAAFEWNAGLFPRLAVAACGLGGVVWALWSLPATRARPGAG